MGRRAGRRRGRVGGGGGGTELEGLFARCRRRRQQAGVGGGQEGQVVPSDYGDVQGGGVRQEDVGPGEGKGRGGEEGGHDGRLGVEED